MSAEGHNVIRLTPEELDRPLGPEWRRRGDDPADAILGWIERMVEDHPARLPVAVVVPVPDGSHYEVHVYDAAEGRDASRRAAQQMAGEDYVRYELSDGPEPYHFAGVADGARPLAILLPRELVPDGARTSDDDGAHSAGEYLAAARYLAKRMKIYPGDKQRLSRYAAERELSTRDAKIELLWRGLPMVRDADVGTDPSDPEWGRAVDRAWYREARRILHESTPDTRTADASPPSGNPTPSPLDTAAQRERIDKMYDIASDDLDRALLDAQADDTSIAEVARELNVEYDTARQRWKRLQERIRAA